MDDGLGVCLAAVVAGEIPENELPLFGFILLSVLIPISPYAFFV